MFGLCHETCGEDDLSRNRRLLLMQPGTAAAPRTTNPMHKQNLAKSPAVAEWFECIGLRSAVHRGMAVLKGLFKGPFDEKGKKVMFGQQRR
jgi:hypothetical protein